MTRVPSTDVLRLQVADEPVGLVNLVANPNGELGGWGWVTPQANTAISGDGTSLTYASSAVGIQGYQTEDMPITAGRYAAASWRLLGGTPAPALGLWVNNQFTWLNASGAVISSTTPSPWHQYNDLGVVLYGPNAAPAGAVKFRLRFNLARSNAGDAINAQPCSLRFNQVTVATAATAGELGTMIVNLVPDPSLELVPITTSWAASGPNVAIARDTGLKANGAASAKLSSTATSVRTNWVRNPNFTNDLTDWAAYDGHTTIGRATGGITEDGGALVLHGDGTTTACAARGTAHAMIPVVPGDALMGRCRFRFGQPGGTWTDGTKVVLSAYFTDAAGNALNTVAYPMASVTLDAADQGVWFDLVSASWLTVPALDHGAVPAGVRSCIRFTTGRTVTAGMDAYADRFLVEKQIPGGGIIGAYFDGATADSTDVTYDWVASSGANDNARTSTQTTKLSTSATPGVRSAEFAVRGGRDYTTSAFALGTGTYSVDVYAQLSWYDIDHHALSPATTTLNLGRADNVVGGGSFQRLHATATTPPSAAFATVAIYPAFLRPASQPFYIDAVQVEPGTSMSSFQIGQVTTGGLPYIPPASWVDIIGSTHDITVARQSLNVGTMTATILDANLDPAASTLIRPGRACRLMAYPDGGAELTPVFTGAIAQAEVTYDPQTPAPKRAKVMLSAVDALARLANIARGEGVGTIAELPYVLEGCGVPWDVNGSGNQVPNATVVARNDSTSALDQVAITRDSAQGVAWLDRFGTLHAYDTAPAPPPPTPTGYRDNVLADNPEAYYRLGESSGTQMADTSTHARHGTYFAAKTAGLGLLVGDSDGATTQPGFTAAAAWMDALTGITLECLVKPSAGQSNRGIVTRYDSPHLFLVWMNVSGQIAVRFYNSGGASVDLAWATAPTVGQTYHVVATYVSGQARLYINGAQVAQSTALTGSLATNPAQSLEVGTYQNNTFTYQGTVDEVAVYSGELSAARILAHYTAATTAPAVMEATATITVPVVDEDIYSDIDISFNTAAVINEVNLAYQRFNATTGDTDEIPYGPYVDAESVAEWGAFSADFRVQGIHEDATTLGDYAQAILDANGTPVRRINSVTVPIIKPEHITTDRALLDLEALVTVNNLAADLGDDLRVQSIEHRITTTTWVMTLGFGVDGQVASPTFTPAPGNTAGLTLDQILRPLGEVTMFWGLKSAIPAGWLPLDGSTFSLTAYPALASLLGSTTLPDMTDRFPIGSGTKALGTIGGSSTVAAAALSHAHPMAHVHKQAAHVHAITGQAADTAPVSGGTAAGSAPRNSNYGGHAHGGSTGDGTLPNTETSSIASTSAGGVVSPVDVLNPWRSLWFIIRAV